jgi:tetratricopeptide (TPR) repeat protein
VALLVPLSVATRHQLYAWRDGATLFGRGLPHNAGDPRFLTQYIEELVHVGDFGRAREQLEGVSRHALDPGKGINIQLTTLSILHRMGDRKGAIVQAREFLRRDPRFWKTRLVLADDLLAEGMAAEAESEYRQVLSVRPIPSYERGYALEGLGLSLFRTGRYEEAAAAYREGLQVSPESVSLRYNMARLLAARGDGAEAERYFEEAARLAPGNARVRMALAEHLLAAGAVGKAATHFDEVARMAPGSAEALLGRGRILEATRRGAEARAVYESALRAPAILPDTHDAVRKRLEGNP